MPHLFNIEFLITSYGYLGVFIVVFLESSIFFALPGDSLLFTVGILASSGFLNIFLLIFGIFCSTFLGGIFGYYIGINLEKLRRFSFWRRILKEEHINKTHNFFEKHGKSAVILSRFVPIVRTFTPVVAGVAKMNYVSFIKYSLVGSTLWSVTITSAGYLLGENFPFIKNYMPLAILLVVFLSILPIVFEVIRGKRKS